MDRRLLGYYNRELQHLRNTAGEFAGEFPKIAGRLSLDEFACADPYVERLLEGFAFLAARVQLKLDAQFPSFTQSLLEIIYPHYLAPTPSMAVVQFQPDLSQSGLTEGYVIDRGESLRSPTSANQRTPCEYRTASPVTLWPIEIVKASYLSRDLGVLGLPADLADSKAAIRLRLRTPEGVTFSKLGLDSMTFFIRGAEEQPARIYEQILAHTTRVVAQPAESPAPWSESIAAHAVTRVGFSDDEALLPVGPRSFQGYRLLHEYFALPERFLFFRVEGLRKAVGRCESHALDLILLLDQEDVELEGRVDRGNFALFCTPAVNLFPKRTDRVPLSRRDSEFHIIPDRTRPIDFEVYQVTSVTGHGVRSDDEQPFQPFYAATDMQAATTASGAYYSINRQPRLLSAREKQRGRRSSYGGSEAFISLVDAKAAPYRSDLRELSVKALCTNRDLPLQMGVGRGATDFELDVSAPVNAVRCVAGPTPPRASRAFRETSWRLISHLSLNYLSLVDSNNGKGAAALRDMLTLYADRNDQEVRKRIEGITSIASQPIMRRLEGGGPVSFARGIEIAVTFDEAAFEGTGVFPLGAVLEVFFSKYVSINSFTETVIRTKERGEIMRWKLRTGLRHLV